MQFALPDSRRALLQAATQAAHRSLDRLVGVLDLAEPREYRRFLEASASALLPLERLLARSSVREVLSDWPQRARSAMLSEDLRELDGTTCELVLEPRSLSAAQVTGVLYVLEGSRLGAQVIAQRLPRCAASRYLTAGDATLWRTFLQRLEAADSPWHPAQTVAAAQWAFAVFQRAFTSLVRPAENPHPALVTSGSSNTAR